MYGLYRAKYIGFLINHISYTQHHNDNWVEFIKVRGHLYVALFGATFTIVSM